MVRFEVYYFSRGKSLTPCCSHISAEDGKLISPSEQENTAAVKKQVDDELAQLREGGGPKQTVFCKLK